MRCCDFGSAVGRGVLAAGQGAAGGDSGVSAAGRGTAAVGHGRGGGGSGSTQQSTYPHQGNGSWSLTCMGINIPIATEQLNQVVTSSAPLLTFSPVVGILPFHLLFCELNKLGKPSTLRLVSLMLTCQTSLMTPRGLL